MNKITVAIAVLTGCVLASAEDLSGAFIAGSPFHDFVQARVTPLDPSAEPALGNHVLILDHGYDALLLRLHLMRNAQRSIDIQTFIWADDECARIFRHELTQAAQRGVKIRIIADQIADPAQLASYKKVSPNIEIKVYRPLANQVKASSSRTIVDLVRPSNINQRMHVKTFIADGIAGITGGRNVGNNYYDYSLDYNFKDREVLVIGPAIKTMAESFNAYWYAEETVSSRDLRDVAKHIESGRSPLSPTVGDVFFNAFFRALNREAGDSEAIRRTFTDCLIPADRVTYIADAPGKKKEDFYFGRGDNGTVTNTLMGLFQEAQDSVLIQSPYVIINRRPSWFFRDIRKRNPDLRIMISTNSFGAADHLITYATNYRLRSRVLLSHGMEVFEYKPHPEDLLHYLPNFDELQQRARDEGKKTRPYLSIHAKTFVFDDHTSFVGTFNLDPRSFYLNSEDGFVIKDKTVTRLLKAKILRDMAPENSWVIAKKGHWLFTVNRGIEAISSRCPIDFWPVRSTSGFELLSGHEPLSSKDPNFYDHYKDIGKFPGANGPSRDMVTVWILKVFGKPATPLL